MCGTGKGHEPEEAQRALQPERGGDGEGYTAEGSTDEQLHGGNPPALGADDIDERTPQGLYDLRQVEPRGVIGYLCV